MYRNKIKELVAWKNSKNRKPLILDGARQVGKTWLLRQFGAENYESVAYVNMDHNEVMTQLFAMDYDIERIIDGLELQTGTKIIPGKTLIILDEIQECPAALASLKYFCENAPEYHVAVAGSLLGIAMHAGSSYPVGKVRTLNLYPMTFSEFVRAVHGPELADALEQADLLRLKPFHTKIIDLLKNYLITGGMPEVVQNYIDEGNVLKTREIQRQIIEDYERDFSKHAPLNLTPKILEVFNILPEELAKENKKFIFKMIRTGARAAEYEDALLWLEDAGIARRILRIKTIKSPLKVYSEKDAFKLYLLDVGLLGAKAELRPEIILNGDELFIEFRGAMAEQFVCEELIAAGFQPYFYKKDKPSQEVDFLLDLGHDILPIEVKSGEKTYSRSLGEYIREHKPKHAVKLSFREFRTHEKGAVDYIPIYLAASVEKIISDGNAGKSAA